MSQSLLSLWFHVRYGASAAELGIVFGAANAITAASLMAAPLIAERVGNLRTMVFTHVFSNVLLALIPFGGSLSLSAALLLARQSLSQMDVPTRQAFMAEIFDEEERVRAFAVTNTFRSLAGLPGPLLVGAMLLLRAPGYAPSDKRPREAGLRRRHLPDIQGQGQMKGLG